MKTNKWNCLKMTDERRGLWFRMTDKGVMQVRAGREGDDDVATIPPGVAEDLLRCFSRVARVSPSPQPSDNFDELAKSQDYHKRIARARKDGSSLAEARKIVSRG